MKTTVIDVKAFVEAVYPLDAEKRETLAEEVRLGRYKEFDPAVFGEVVDHIKAHGSLPALPCEMVQLVMPTHDRHNYKVFGHYCTCDGCKQVVTVQ